jgi:hypothetical protein
MLCRAHYDEETTRAPSRGCPYLPNYKDMYWLRGPMTSANLKLLQLWVPGSLRADTRRLLCQHPLYVDVCISVSLKLEFEA